MVGNAHSQERINSRANFQKPCKTRGDQDHPAFHKEENALSIGYFRPLGSKKGFASKGAVLDRRPGDPDLGTIPRYMPPIGLLLSNLGTPQAPTAAAVRPYLRQFLTDRRVIDIPWLPRQLLVNGIIAPFRSPRSAHAYAKVWTPEGSPLLVHSRALANGVAERLGSTWKVALGMRYGKPSLETALQEILAAGCRKILVFPLYPQYASATTGSTVEEVWRLAGRRENVPELRVMPAFPVHPGLMDVQASLVEPLLGRVPEEHVLFSFHGLPERQIHKADEGGECLSQGCCAALTDANRLCYKAQCHATARALAAKLGLADGTWTVSYQSRLGKTPWIGPSTDQATRDLAAKGCRNLVVVPPAFVADCLETLEEIGMVLRATFLGAGGRSFAVAPCPNADPKWVGVVADMASSYLERQP